MTAVRILPNVNCGQYTGTSTDMAEMVGKAHPGDIFFNETDHKIYQYTTLGTWDIFQ